MKLKLIDYNIIRAKFLVLGLRALSRPNTWSIRPLMQNKPHVLFADAFLVVGYSTKIVFWNKEYYDEDLDLLFNDICKTVKEYDDT